MLRGRKVCGGRAEGEALVTRQTIPGWGGVNPVQGIITETQHELRGQSFKDKVLVFRGAKGSSGWSAMYHTARLAGTAPRALIFNEMTTKVALGAVVMRVPSITDLDQDPLDVIETGDWVTVDADRGIVEVVKKSTLDRGGSSDPPGLRMKFDRSERWSGLRGAGGRGVHQEARSRRRCVMRRPAPWPRSRRRRRPGIRPTSRSARPVIISTSRRFAFRVARDHRVPLNEEIAKADAIKAFTFADIDRAVQYTYVIEPAMDDAYRMVAANAAGVKPNLGAAVYARLLISRQNREGDWDGFHQRPPSSYSRVTMAALGLRAVQVYHHPSQKTQADAAVARARKFLEARTPRDTEERSYQLLGLRWAGADRATLQKDGGPRCRRRNVPTADGARCRDARATCIRPARRSSRCTTAPASRSSIRRGSVASPIC